MENNQEQFTNSTGIFPIENIPEQDIPTQNISGEDTPAADSKYQPISTWGYIGIILLLSIPIAGPIIAIVWAFGGCRKVNKRNFARASLIISLFMLIASLVVGMAIKKAVEEVVAEVESAISSFTNVQSGDVSLDELMGIVNLLEGMSDSTTNEGNNTPAVDGIDSLENLEGMEDIDALMKMLEGLSGEVSGGDLSMYGDLSIYEDFDTYEDMLNSLFNDIVFETEEESTEQQGGN